jgi:hypothetical protein
MVQRIAIAIALGVLGLPMSGIVAAEDRPQIEIGRYQVIVLYNADASALLIDTVTGRTWVLSGKKARTWSDLNYGKMEGDRLALTPPPCTQDNPSCYFPSTGTGQKAAEDNPVQ